MKENMNIHLSYKSLWHLSNFKIIHQLTASLCKNVSTSVLLSGFSKHSLTASCKSWNHSSNDCFSSGNIFFKLFTHTIELRNTETKTCPCLLISESKIKRNKDNILLVDQTCGDPGLSDVSVQWLPEKVTLTVSGLLSC